MGASSPRSPRYLHSPSSPAGEPPGRCLTSPSLQESSGSFGFTDTFGECLQTILPSSPHKPHKPSPHLVSLLLLLLLQSAGLLSGTHLHNLTNNQPASTPGKRENKSDTLPPASPRSWQPLGPCLAGIAYEFAFSPEQPWRNWIWVKPYLLSTVPWLVAQADGLLFAQGKLFRGTGSTLP